MLAIVSWADALVDSTVQTAEGASVGCWDLQATIAATAASPAVCAEPCADGLQGRTLPGPGTQAGTVELYRRPAMLLLRRIRVCLSDVFLFENPAAAEGCRESLIENVLVKGPTAGRSSTDKDALQMRSKGQGCDQKRF